MALLLWLMCCLFVALPACSGDDDGPGDDAGQLSDASDAGDTTDAAPDSSRDTNDEDSEGYCTTSSPCCGDDGNVSSYVRCEACPAGTSYDRCSEAARCADSPVPEPECFDADGDQVPAVCVSQGERDEWECPEEADPEEPDPCENPTSPAPITGVDISTAIFVGRPALPPAESPSTPTPISDFDEYRAAFAYGADTTGRADGELSSGGSASFTATGENLLAWSVFLFFENGGDEAIVVPTADDVPTSADLAPLEQLSTGGLLVVPGLASADTDRARRDGFNRLESALNSEHNEDIFFIGDLPAGTPASAVEESSLVSPLDLHHERVALYHPWLEVTSAVDSAQSASIPPSGAVAGIVARTDRERGIWKAPAGPEADIRSIQGLAQRFDTSETDTLNQNEVNTLRVLDGETVVWGGRTRQASSPEWKYVSTRRLAMHVEQSIYAGTEWAAFQPNDDTLWSTLESETQDFLHDLWSRGGLQGTTESEAYFARVDATTTTSADINDGNAVIQLGIASERPAEFNVLQIDIPAGTCVE